MPEQRRLSPRVHFPYTARLWSTDAAGRTWKADTVLDNISTGGLYLRLNRCVRAAAHVHVAVRLSAASAETYPALGLVAECAVLRIEPHPGKTWRAAVEFRRLRVF